jgi:hypothetical protein
MTGDLREAWRRAEARVARFAPHSLLWMAARDEADAARRTYEKRLRKLSRQT